MKDPKKIFLTFIHERERIRCKKELGLPRPWTNDPILEQYRFCNVNREHDKVTRWIDANIRDRFHSSPHLWFTLIIARLINQPSSLDRIYRGSSLGVWNKVRFLRDTDPDTQPKPIFNAAYIVSTNGMKKQKNRYVAEDVLDPIWSVATSKSGEGLISRLHDCQDWANWLLKFNGMGDFMVNQIVTDYKYTKICQSAPDRSTFVMAGPGTRRGLNRYFGRDRREALNRTQAQIELMQIRRDISNTVSTDIKEYFDDPNNLSNCFCEFDKYMRALTGQGRPKQHYKERT